MHQLVGHQAGHLGKLPLLRLIHSIDTDSVHARLGQVDGVAPGIQYQPARQRQVAAPVLADKRRRHAGVDRQRHPLALGLQRQLRIAQFHVEHRHYAFVDRKAALQALLHLGQRHVDVARADQGRARGQRGAGKDGKGGGFQQGTRGAGIHGNSRKIGAAILHSALPQSKIRRGPCGSAPDCLRSPP